MKEKGLERTILTLRVLFIAGIVCVFLYHPVKWMVVSYIPEKMLAGLVPLEGPGFYSSMPFGVRAILAAISLLPGSIAALELLFLYRLFGWFHQGRFFDAANARLIRRIGILLLLSVPADIVARFLMDFGFNVVRPVGRKVLNIGLSSGNIQAAVIGLIVLVAAAVIERGCALDEENRLTI